MIALCLLLLAAASPQFDVRDARDRRAGGVSLEAVHPDADGWLTLQITKAPPGAVIVWPYDTRVKQPETSGSIPVVVSLPQANALRANTRAAAAIALRGESAAALDLAQLKQSSDPLAKGSAFLLEGEFAQAVAPLAVALQNRERQLVRIPSEIYAAAMLFGRALLGAGKYDDAAVAFRKALLQRPSDRKAKELRTEALLGAGKPDSAEH